MIKKIIKIIIWLLIISLAVWYIKFAKHYPYNTDLSEAKFDYWGVTYSPKFAEELELDWKETYLAILDDLKVKNIRIPIYWDLIETKQGSFDFAIYDYIFNQAAKRDVKIIANIGWRLPRWPECHAPTWAQKMTTDEIQPEILDMLEIVVNRYYDREEIVAWQVENEPLLDTFGLCPDGDEDFLKQEIALVKGMDKHRDIIVSASGELSTWSHEVKLADIFGTTMYRVVWNPWFRYFRYPIPAWFYKTKANVLGVSTENIIISELQAEPWVPNGTLANQTTIESNKSFNLEQFVANLEFAIKVDFQQTYLWGVEWWYQQFQTGHPEYWDMARTLFAEEVAEE